MSSQVQLTSGQINAVQQARRILNDILPSLEAAEKCGVNCADLRQARDQIASGLDKIVQHFGMNVGPQT